MAQTRLLARGLMPLDLHAEGLIDGLAEMMLQMSQGPTRCVLVCPSVIRLGDDMVANHLFRIAQEAVNNATRHGRAKKVTVTLSQTGEAITLRIDDDGKGLDAAPKTGGGVGLQIMRHRANVIGARFEARTRLKRGTRIICTVGTPA